MQGPPRYADQHRRTIGRRCGGPRDESPGGNLGPSIEGPLIVQTARDRPRACRAPMPATVNKARHRKPPSAAAM